jgi:hypothetical protein
LLVPILVLVVLLIATGVLGVGLAQVVVGLGPVTRSRLDRFVARTGVRFTAANAPYVLDSLARTMRWRTAGVVLASAAWLAWDVLHETLNVGTYTGVILATGFLIGSVVGEVGNAVSRGSGPRTASLAARREQDYVGSWARSWPRAVGLLSLVAGALAAVVRADAVSAALLVAIVLVAWAAGRGCTRLILERPRPAESDADVLSADDGLRSRALHAVGGAVVLAASWSSITLVAFLVQGDASRDGVVAGVALLVMAGVARVAWRRATAPFLVVGAATPPVPAPVREGPAA